MRDRHVGLAVGLVAVLVVGMPADRANAAEPFCGDVQLVWAGGTGCDIADGPQFTFLNRELRGDAQVEGRIGPALTTRLTKSARRRVRRVSVHGRWIAGLVLGTDRYDCERLRGERGARSVGDRCLHGSTDATSDMYVRGPAMAN